MTKTKTKKQRFKKTVTPTSSLVSAAVSINSQLYLEALEAAADEHEGNFSSYVRKLIRRDLGRTAA